MFCTFWFYPPFLAILVSQWVKFHMYISVNKTNVVCLLPSPWKQYWNPKMIWGDRYCPSHSSWHHYPSHMNREEQLTLPLWEKARTLATVAPVPLKQDWKGVCATFLRNDWQQEKFRPQIYPFSCFSIPARLIFYLPISITLGFVWPEFFVKQAHFWGFLIQKEPLNRKMNWS